MHKMVFIMTMALLITGFLLSPAFAKEQAKRVEVNHEWGTLKEVIVGHGEDLVIPSFTEAVDFIYDPAFIELMKKDGGKPASEVEPERTKKVIAQLNNLVKVLEARGIKVHRPHHLKGHEATYMNDVQKGSMFIYARDPVLVIGNNIIETAIKIPERAKEKFGIRPIIQSILKDSPAKYVAIPSVSPNFGNDQIYLEGGDVLLNGYEIYVGNSGKGSNKAGIAWLQNYLGDKYKVHEIKVDSDFEHLDCIMALVRPGLGVLCKEALKGELPDSLKDWDFIDVSKAEAKKLGANLLVLDSKTVIIDKQHHRIGEELKKRGTEVIEIPYDAVATWGGAFRCSHHPIKRESELK